MADGFVRVDGWGPAIQPGTITLVTVEDRQAAANAAAAAAASAADAAVSAGAATDAAANAAQPIPGGGNTGQVLAKASGLDRDVAWVNPSGGGGGGGSYIDGAPPVWPSTFPASPHTHPVTDIADMTALGRSLAKANTALDARTAIGAGTGNGTSNLALGNTGTTAAAGNHTHAAAAVGFTPAGGLTATDVQSAIVQAAASGGGAGIGNTVTITSASAARVHPVTGAALPSPPDCVVFWFSDTAPVHFVTGDVWVTPAT